MLIYAVIVFSIAALGGLMLAAIGMKSKKPKKPTEHALLIEWGGLMAGAYGRSAVLALVIPTKLEILLDIHCRRGE